MKNKQPCSCRLNYLLQGPSLPSYGTEAANGVKNIIKKQITHWMEKTNMQLWPSGPHQHRSWDQLLTVHRCTEFGKELCSVRWQSKWPDFPMSSSHNSYTCHDGIKCILVSYFTNGGGNWYRISPMLFGKCTHWSGA